jgi:hypothetical protein
VRAAPTRGTLRIDADVAGAQVFIDRQFLGRAPVTAHNLHPGTPSLNVHAPGLEGVAEMLEVEPGARAGFDLDQRGLALEARRRQVETRGARQLFVGRQGRAPEDVAVDDDLRAGHVRIEAQGPAGRGGAHGGGRGRLGCGR